MCSICSVFIYISRKAQDLNITLCRSQKPSLWIFMIQYEEREGKSICIISSHSLQATCCPCGEVSTSLILCRADSLVLCNGSVTYAEICGVAHRAVTGQLQMDSVYSRFQPTFQISASINLYYFGYKVRHLIDFILKKRTCAF